MRALVVALALAAVAAIVAAPAEAQPQRPIEQDFDVVLVDGVAASTWEPDYRDAEVESIESDIIEGGVVTQLKERTGSVLVEFEGSVGRGVVEITAHVVSPLRTRDDIFRFTYNVYGINLYDDLSGEIVYYSKGTRDFLTGSDGVGVVRAELYSGDRAKKEDIIFRGIKWSEECSVVRSVKKLTDDCAIGFASDYKKLAYKVQPKLGGGKQKISIEWPGLAEDGDAFIAEMNVIVPDSRGASNISDSDDDSPDQKETDDINATANAAAKSKGVPSWAVAVIAVTSVLLVVLVVVWCYSCRSGRGGHDAKIRGNALEPNITDSFPSRMRIDDGTAAVPQLQRASITSADVHVEEPLSAAAVAPLRIGLDTPASPPLPLAPPARHARERSSVSRLVLPRAVDRGVDLDSHEEEDDDDVFRWRRTEDRDKRMSSPPAAGFEGNNDNPEPVAAPLPAPPPPPRPVHRQQKGAGNLPAGVRRRNSSDERNSKGLKGAIRRVKQVNMLDGISSLKSSMFGPKSSSSNPPGPGGAGSSRAERNHDSDNIP